VSEKRNNIVRIKQEKCVRKKEKVVRKGTIVLKRSGKCVRKNGVRESDHWEKSSRQKKERHVKIGRYARKRIRALARTMKNFVRSTRAVLTYAKGC